MISISSSSSSSSSISISISIIIIIIIIIIIVVTITVTIIIAKNIPTEIRWLKISVKFSMGLGIIPLDDQDYDVRTFVGSLRPISLLRISLLRFVDSNIPEKETKQHYAERDIWDM